MGFLAQDYTIVASNTREITSFPVGDATLLALSAVVLADNTTSTDLWLEIGILSGGAGTDHRAAVLNNGYAGTANSIFWSGAMPLERDSRVYALVEGAVSDQFRLIALLAPEQTVIIPQVPRVN